MHVITDIQVIGNEVAIKWEDGSEGFIAMDQLRKLSPSAETTGERDLLGNQFTGDQRDMSFAGVTVTSWKVVGNYAIQFSFSDNHSSGLYTFDYLREITSY